MSLVRWPAVYSCPLLIRTEGEWGEGYHAWTLDPAEIEHFFHAFWAMLWCYCGSLACTRISLLLQYKAIFPPKRFQIAVKLLLAFVGLAGLWSTLSGIFICWPISYLWTHQGDGKCFKTWPLFIGNAGRFIYPYSDDSC